MNNETNMHPTDIIDALEWALRNLRTHAPENGLPPIDRMRMHTLQRMCDEAQRAALSPEGR